MHHLLHVDPSVENGKKIVEEIKKCIGSF